MANSPSDLREQLIRALEADLIGPFDPESGEEVLRLPPSRWYLTGFLAPQGGREPLDPQEQDPTGEDELGVEDDHDEESGGTDREREPKQKNRLPASMGLSVLLPPGPSGDTVRVRVRWAEYELEEREREGRRPERVWRRMIKAPVVRDLPLDPAAIAKGVPITEDGVELAGKLETGHLPEPGTRTLALFVVNRREPLPNGPQDARCLFQVEMAITCTAGIVARPNQSDGNAGDRDAREADLQFRAVCEYAVGHGVSAAAEPGEDGRVTTVRTAWIPRAEVPRVVTGPEVGVTSMEELAALDGAGLRRALEPLPAAYGAWIAGQRQIDPGPGAGRRATRDALMDDAARAAARIADGIELLERDAEVRQAFQWANRAMALAARRRNPERYPEGKVPRWRLFQLAFLLLNLPGLADPRREDRDDVELIFFPTGGGKTEAYLGVIAFVLLLRRLRGRDRPDGGLGVAVILRYTLRLLTLDQLARAATLVCALEMLRREHGEQLGGVRFAVGLWVGRSATANTLFEVKTKILDYKNSASKSAESPFPLTHCPWCNEPLGKDSLTLEPHENPREVVVGCGNFRCDFAAGRAPEGLPVLFVDEQVYRELPAFLLATVDKLALLPWRGEAGMLFGRVQVREGRRFWGPVDAALGEIPGSARGARNVLPAGLPPPELIVQDELHLISGPLGTMAGLYETAVDALCTHTLADGTRVRPKILASTATVRRAREQILSLFGRERTAVFPPPGVDDGATWFARIDDASPGRLYVGVAATGRAMKAILLRVYVALLAAANRLWEPQGAEDQTADAWMTLVGYFNSLRELGGMRRLVEDEVRTRCDKAEDRKPEDWTGPHPWFRNRRVTPEPVELTSREDVGAIKRSKARISRAYNPADPVDVVLASNMISVGVDIDRLGLMVVAGQPKSNSEYIQASSRVGRQPERPGLVVTCFNLHKPRDRSHYERFPAYHQSFYRYVEASSLTPFSGPALDRGLAGTLLAMVRHEDPALTPSAAAMRIGDHRELAEEVVQSLAGRGALQPGLDGERREAVRAGLTARARALVEAWERLAQIAPGGGYRRIYSPWDRGKGATDRQMLRTVLERTQDQEPREVEMFRAPSSLRDVEPSTHLWLSRGRLGGRS